MLEDLFGYDEVDELDQAEIWDYLSSEINELKKHKDILGDGYIELDVSRDLE